MKLPQQYTNTNSEDILDFNSEFPLVKLTFIAESIDDREYITEKVFYIEDLLTSPKLIQNILVGKIHKELIKEAKKNRSFITYYYFNVEFNKYTKDLFKENKNVENPSHDYNILCSILENEDFEDSYFERVFLMLRNLSYT